MNDLMIDLETLSTRQDAYIISIGACMFDIQTGEIGEKFHTHISFFNTGMNGHISSETVAWWLTQSEDARNAITNNKDALTFPSAIFDLRSFIVNNNPCAIWSNGATFDLVILRSAFDRIGCLIPWTYWQERDTRTLVDIADRITGINSKKTIEFYGIKHDALGDAIHQSKYIASAYNVLKTYTQTTL